MSGACGSAARARSSASTRKASSTRRSRRRTLRRSSSRRREARPRSRGATRTTPSSRSSSPIVLANSGQIDPERIESYIAAGGYRALHDVLREMTPDEVSTRSPRAGCGGAGARAIPPGLKWGTVAKTPGAAEVRRLQRRRGRPRRLHGPQRPRERPAPRARGHGHRRLRGRRRPGLHLRPRRVPARDPPAPDRHQARPGGSGSWAADLRVAVQLPHRHPHRRRGVRLRRGDGAHGLDRGQARHAPPPAAVIPRKAGSGAARP